MRILTWIALGFATGCIYCVSNPVTDVGAVPAAVLLAAALVTAVCSGKRLAVKTVSLVLAGFGAALLWYQAYTAAIFSGLSPLEGTTQTVQITALDYSREQNYGRSLDGELSRNGKTWTVRVYLKAGEEISPGSVVSGDFLFRLTTPGSEQGMTSHSGKGIFLLAYQRSDTVLTQEEDKENLTFLMRTALLRRQIREVLRQCFPEDVYGFTKALLLGDTNDLGYEVDTHLKLSGIRHVAAVSGLHVSILFALVCTVTFRKRLLSAVVGYPLLLLFAAVAGFTPSVTRACLMCALMLLGTVVNREYDAITGVSFSALVMLACNPFVITSVSFRLSVASVTGIFLFAQPMREWMYERISRRTGKTGKRLCVSVSISLSAMVFTVPLCAWYFGTVSLIGVVTNLLTLWVISMVFYGIMGVCVLFPWNQSLAVWLGELVAWPIRYVLKMAKVLASFPVACVYTASAYMVVWLILAYLLLAVFLLSKQKKPKQLLCFGMLGLCLALLLSWTEPMLYKTSITVLDVGQGQCILIQSEGKTILVDCGGDSDTGVADLAASRLLSMGVSRLDSLILTHMDRDHAGGARYLLSRIPADVVIRPPSSDGWIPENGEVIYADRELSMVWGNTTLRIFGENMPESRNENSLCILLDTENCDILITGDRDRDGELRLLETADLGDVDVLVAGHHGAADAVSRELLEAVRPETVCISAGVGNVYGHPAEQTLQRLREFGCRTVRTDVHGTIMIRR